MDDELYGCFPYYSYAASSSDFTTTTTSTSPQHHNHHHLLSDPLPPPPNNNSIIVDDFASYHDHQHPMLCGSVVEPFYSHDADADLSSALLRARIASHPLYSTLLQAYIDCQKVGAPPEIANLLDQIQRDNGLSRTTAITSCFDPDPELDEFMESYCVILSQYRSDLAKPFYEATSYLNNMEAQLSSLCKCSRTASVTHVSEEAAGSSEEDASGGESADMIEFLPNVEDQELKDKLLRKYSGYISSLKHEFSKKKKKGKLPKDAKQLLHSWWIDHNKWPYPTEADKIDLAQRTGLDQKQINNWFINQRKRHWKPSESLQFMEMNGFCGPFHTSD